MIPGCCISSLIIPLDTLVIKGFLNNFSSPCTRLCRGMDHKSRIPAGDLLRPIRNRPCLCASPHHGTIIDSCGYDQRMRRNKKRLSLPAVFPLPLRGFFLPACSPLLRKACSTAPQTGEQTPRAPSFSGGIPHLCGYVRMVQEDVRYL